MKTLVTLIFLFHLNYITAQPYFHRSDTTIPHVFTLNTNTPKKTNCSSVIRIKNYIALDANNTMIAGVRNLFFYEDKIILFDDRSSAVHVFDKYGKLKTSISSKGNGPDEWISVTYIAVNKKNGNILIPDRFKRILYEYSIDGKLLNRTKTQISFTTFVMHGNGYIIGSRNDTYGRKNNKAEIYYVINPEAKPHDMHFQATNYKGKYYPFSVDYWHNIYNFNGDVHYIPFFKFRMYVINEQGLITPKYFFNFGKQSFRPALFENSKDVRHFVNEVLTNNDVVLINEVYESNKHIYLSAHSWHKNRSFYYLIDKNNGKLLIDGDLFDDIGCGYSRTVLANNDRFYSVLFPYEIISDKLLKEKIENHIKTKIDIYSNPIIVEYEIL